MLPNEGVLNRVSERVSDVQDSSDIGRWDHHTVATFRIWNRDRYKLILSQDVLKVLGELLGNALKTINKEMNNFSGFAIIRRELDNPGLCHTCKLY